VWRRLRQASVADSSPDTRNRPGARAMLGYHLHMHDVRLITPRFPFASPASACSQEAAA